MSLWSAGLLGHSHGPPGSPGSQLACQRGSLQTGATSLYHPRPGLTPRAILFPPTPTRHHSWDSVKTPVTPPSLGGLPLGRPWLWLLQTSHWQWNPQSQGSQPCNLGWLCFILELWPNLFSPVFLGIHKSTYLCAHVHRPTGQLL